MTVHLVYPDRRQISPDRATAILERLGAHWITPALFAGPWPPIVPVLVGGKEWWVGDQSVASYVGDEDGFPFIGNWSCDCTARTPAHCTHVALAQLALAWGTESARPLFQQPKWALDLEPLQRGKGVEDDSGSREGMVRYRLLPVSEADGAFPIRRELIRFSRRDGRGLRPQSMPDSIGELEAKVTSLTPVDRAVQMAVEQIRQLKRLVRDPAVGVLIERLAADAFAQLLKLDFIEFGERQLSPRAEPLAPCLQVADGPDGIELAWQTPLIEVYGIGPGYAITEAGELRPIDAPQLKDVRGALLVELPTVPIDEAELFLERFVETSGVPVDLASAYLPPTMLHERLTARVMLAELEDCLRIELRFGYHFDGVETEVVADDPSALVKVGAALVVRDPARETELATALSRSLGRPAPAMIQGDIALDFLLEGRRHLGSEFIFFGADDLVKHRVVGTLQPKVRIPSGIDWFDLKIEFHGGGAALPARAVLDSWIKGRRYHRLPDGTIARLPDAWLEKHGETSLQIEEIRGGDGPIGPMGAPLVAELLDQAEGDVERWTTLVSRLTTLDRVPERAIPDELQAELRDYQHSGYRWLIYLRDAGLGGVLADDMGLGKTVQAICALLDTHRPGGKRSMGPPSLIVAPTSVVHNWKNEVAKFAPMLRVKVHHGLERGHGDAFDKVDLVVTSYALLRLDNDTFGTRRWRYAVLDEAQQIKNPASLVARAARALKTDHRLALTGTPLENHLVELWSIFDFVNPGFFGSRASFQRRFAAPIQRHQDEAALGRLRRRIRPFILRRHKSEVASELPPRQEQVLYCELGPEQRALYERVKGTYRSSVLGKVDRDGLARSTLSVLEALMRLRQACCDPGLLPFAEAQALGQSAKTDLLMSTLHDIVEENHRSLVFSQWPSLLRRVAKDIEARGWTYLYLDGGTTRRGELVEQWNDPTGPPIFLISLKAGGAGLNLTGADHVIHLDPWWNPAVEDQATDRAHRIGQTKPVVAYKLVARNTVEEKILELQARKRALFEAAVEQDRVLVEQLSRADLEAVFAPSDDIPDVEIPLTVVTPADVSAPRPELKSRSSAPRTAALPSGLPQPLADMLAVGDRLTNALVRDRMGWDADRARQWLRDQVSRGVLEQRGRKRGTHYVLRAR